ncbi:MAG: hypothetical protein V4760_06150 [Bdellovibrionota bacterium]
MKTATAEIFLHQRGITVVRIDRGAKQTLVDAESNLATAILAGEGVRRPLLTDIRYCEPMTPEARRYYSGKILVDSFTALAMLIHNSTFGTMMGNIYLKIAKPGIPTQLFTDEGEALDWLAKH